jgi:hypothetical protein
LAADWVDKLLARWDNKGIVKGHWLESGDYDCGHINGNALFAVNTFTSSYKFLGAPADKGWDTWFAPEMKNLGWEDIAEIRSWFRKENLTEKEFDKLKAEGCVWLHGVKDNSAIDIVKKKVINH